MARMTDEEVLRLYEQSQRVGSPNAEELALRAEYRVHLQRLQQLEREAEACGKRVDRLATAIEKAVTERIWREHPNWSRDSVLHRRNAQELIEREVQAFVSGSVKAMDVTPGNQPHKRNVSNLDVVDAAQSGE